MTDANGNFAIDPSSGGSSGSKTLRAVAPSGRSLTPGAAGYTVSTTSGATSGPYSFGAYATPSLSDNGDTPLSVVTGQSFTSTVASFFDSAGADSNPANFSATVTWAGGIQSAGTIVPDGNGDYTVTATHAYPTAGSYAASVAIAGPAGESLTTSVTVAVSNAAPVLAPIPDQDPTPGSPLTITVPFTGADPYATYTATVDWGDGNGPQPATVANGTVTATLANVPSQPLNATVTLTDSYGGSTTIGVPVNDAVLIPDGSDSIQPISQEGTAAGSTAIASARVWTVSYGATNPARFHQIRQDGTNSVYGPADWEDDNLDGHINGDEHDYPVCYTRTGPYGPVRPVAGANIILTSGLVPGDTYAISANGDNETWTAAKAATVVPTAYGLALSALVTCNGLITNRVRLGFLDLDWMVTDMTTGATLDAGWTQNRIYVTFSDPQTKWDYSSVTTPVDGGPPVVTTDSVTAPLETVLLIGCEGAQSAKTYNDVVNGVWNKEFKTLQVRDAEGHLMHYWGKKVQASAAANGNPALGFLPGIDVASGLIANHDGQCGAWAGLLVDVLRAQGINAYEFGITPTNRAKYAGFLANTEKAQGGVAGQSSFKDHAVVELSANGGGSVYDPSYGNWFSSEQAWMDGSVAALQQPGSLPDVPYVPNTNAKGLTFVNTGQ